MISGTCPLVRPGPSCSGSSWRRGQRGSLAVTTNLDFGEWQKVFGDEKMTAALLGRLTHRAHILAMNGESYRFRESMRRQEVV